MRLENGLKINNGVDDFSYDSSLHNNFMRLRVVYDALTVTESIPYDEAVKYIGSKVDLVIPSYGHEAKGKASTVAGFKDGKPVIFRQGEITLD